MYCDILEDQISRGALEVDPGVLRDENKLMFILPSDHQPLHQGFWWTTSKLFRYHQNWVWFKEIFKFFAKFQVNEISEKIRENIMIFFEYIFFYINVW